MTFEYTDAPSKKHGRSFCALRAAIATKSHSALLEVLRWLECVGIADRSAFDLNAHARVPILISSWPHVL